MRETPALDPITLYLQQLPKVRHTRQEEARLARATKRGPKAKRQEATKRLVLSVLPLAVSIAARFQNRGLSFEDLIGCANLATMKAVQKFNPEYGLRLTTYVGAAVWRSLQLEITVQPKAVNLPAWMASKSERDKKMRANGPAVKAVQNMASLDAPWKNMDCYGDEFEADPHQVVGDTDALFDFDGDERQVLRRKVLAALRSLPDREQQAMNGVLQGRTLRDVGDAMGVSKERVRQLCMSAKEKLRELLT